MLGTIHGESALSVYERVVHDMGIPKEAFLATDLVLTMGLTRPGGSSRAVRRLVEIAECRRRDEEVELHQLMAEREEGQRALLAGSRTVARIASSWDLTMDEALDNIEARTNKRRVLLDKASTSGTRFLEPEWVFRCNRFLWDRLDAGDRDFRKVVSDFRRFVEGRA